MQHVSFRLQSIRLKLIVFIFEIERGRERNTNTNTVFEWILYIQLLRKILYQPEMI